MHVTELTIETLRWLPVAERIWSRASKIINLLTHVSIVYIKVLQSPGLANLALYTLWGYASSTL